MGFWKVLFLGKQFLFSFGWNPLSFAVCGLVVRKVCLRMNHRESTFLRTWLEEVAMFQHTYFSSCHPLSVKKKGFIKGETRCLLRTNLIKEGFESNKRDFKFRLLEGDHPQKVVNQTQAEVEFTPRNNALIYKLKTSKTFYRSSPPTNQVYRDSKRSLWTTGLWSLSNRALHEFSRITKFYPTQKRMTTLQPLQPVVSHHSVVIYLMDIVI